MAKGEMIEGVEDTGNFIIVTVLVAAFVLALFVLAIVEKDSRTQAVKNYLATHKCEHTGYTGESDERVYQCDGKPVRERDMK